MGSESEENGKECKEYLWEETKQIESFTEG